MSVPEASEAVSQWSGHFKSMNLLESHFMFVIRIFHINSGVTRPFLILEARKPNTVCYNIRICVAS